MPCSAGSHPAGGSKPERFVSYAKPLRSYSPNATAVIPAGGSIPISFVASCMERTLPMQSRTPSSSTSRPGRAARQKIRSKKHFNVPFISAEYTGEPMIMATGMGRKQYSLKFSNATRSQIFRKSISRTAPVSGTDFSPKWCSGTKSAKILYRQKTGHRENQRCGVQPGWGWGNRLSVNVCSNIVFY